MDVVIARGNVKDMLEARGDDVSYIQEHGDAVDATKYHTNVVALTTDKTCVIFALTDGAMGLIRKALKEVTPDTVTQQCWWCKITGSDARNDTGKQRYIVIVRQMPSKQTIDLMDKLHMQLFLIKELQYNPLKHELVPPHSILTAPEKKAFLKEYRIGQVKHLPYILRNDVIARWIGAVPDDIIKITRFSESAGEYQYYRLCI